MSRSTWTNAFIRALLAHPMAVKVKVDDDGENHTCKSFREVADVMDSVDLSYVTAFNEEGKQIGWFMFIMGNDDDEQLSDYTANDFCDNLVQSVKVTGDE